MVLLFNSRNIRQGIIDYLTDRVDLAAIRSSVGVLGGVQRDVLMSPEAQRVRVRREASTEEIRPEDKVCCGLPASCATAILDSPVRLSYGVEVGIEIGDKLIIDCVTVWTNVGRIDGIRVVIEWRLVAESHLHVDVSSGTNFGYARQADGCIYAP